MERLQRKIWHTMEVPLEVTMDKHYDVGILGVWFGCNYGSIATYYCLHQAVESLGKSVLMVHRPWIKPFDQEAMEKRHSLKFARKHYEISECYQVEDTKKLNDLCDTFLLGADQLWKYGVTKIFGHSYFLDFAEEGKRRIAYATSFGADRFIAPWSFMWKAVKCLRRMNYVSVREEINVRMCRKMLGIEAKHVLDPVLLCDSSVLGNVAEESSREKKTGYIAAYILDPTPQKRAALLRMAEKYQTDLVVMLDGWPNLFKKNKEAMDLPEYTVSDLDVTDWLFYFKHADIVITDSFHGTCVAMLFEKPFYAITNPQRGADRFISLLTDFDLMSRYVTNPDKIGAQELPEIDYGEVNRKLAAKRQESFAWLKNALESPEENHSVVIKEEKLYPLRVLKSIGMFEMAKNTKLKKLYHKVTGR